MGLKYNTGRKVVTANKAQGIRKCDKPALRLAVRIAVWEALPASNNARGENSRQNCQKPGSLRK